jgi:hypothetical protein
MNENSTRPIWHVLGAGVDKAMTNPGNDQILMPQQ